MDVSIRTFIHSICSVFFSDDICSLNIIPNKVKLLTAILLIPLILTILYRKIISNHDHFEYFSNSKYKNSKNNKNSKNSNKYKCCRKIPIILNNYENNRDASIISKANNIPNVKIAEIQIKNTPCSIYNIDKPKIDYLYRRKDKTHKYLGSRCLNTYSISKKLMKRYKHGKNMFHSNFPLFDKV